MTSPKLISILCLGKRKECDYVRFLRAESIICIDSACPCDREDRKEVQSSIMTSFGSIHSSESAQVIADRLQEALSSVV